MCQTTFSTFRVWAASLPYHPSFRFRAQSTVAVAALLPNPFGLVQ